ncbi:hypothetical protein [Paenibacillus sp. Aloe-11]|uniref:hypothetical protein n=1 Tax=Paenibacillus sp. Aloe-11 TaxID=1050222 RepID=UPI00024EFF91|nr:hypothetical protein [Paenibacillus sp. Aloe-11]EHS59428.1 hypothetical protein WG8_0643 [Paenibacillus sp. Aloe-11]
MTERNWQEDMNLCMKVDEAWSRELLIADQPDITTYWLHQAKREKERADAAESDYEALSANYDKLKKERDFWETKRTEHKNRADQAESLIQQKDTEIAKLRSAIEKAIAEYNLYEEPSAAADCMWQILYTHVQPEQASFLQGKGDKL